MPIRLDRAAAVDSWGPYVRAIADLVELRDWHIDLCHDDAAPENQAEILCFYGKHRAAIRFSDDFLSHASPEDQRHTVVHELMHCHLDAGMAVAEDAMPESAHAAHTRMMEHGVDAIATAIARWLPLPEDIESPPARGEPTMAKKKAKKGKTGGPMSPGVGPKPKGVNKPANGNRPIARKKGGMGGGC